MPGKVYSIAAEHPSRAGEASRLAGEALTHLRPQVRDIHRFHAIPAERPVSVHHRDMTVLLQLRTLAPATVLLASMIVTTGPAWAAPAGPAPSDSPHLGRPANHTADVTADDTAADWGWPLRPRPPVVREFDPPDKPWGSGHRGVDLLGAERQRVRSAAAGVVTYAGTLAGRGVIAVTHGEIRTTYEPVEPAVEFGDRVRAGDVIGRLQTAASHCAPERCLHWGALRDSTYLDPLGLVGASGTIRLLPLRGPAPVAGIASVPGAVEASRSPAAVRSTTARATVGPPRQLARLAVAAVFSALDD